MASAPRVGRERLPTGRLLLYALPSIVSSVAVLPLVLFIPAFYADDLGVPLASVGLALVAARLLDVGSDFLVGVLSDRMPSRFGRRKPWIVFGTPLFVVAIWQLFVPGAEASAAHVFVWSGLLSVGATFVDLPHRAWGAELSSDYDERSRVTSVREGLSTAGQVALLAALLVAVWNGVESVADQLRGIAWFIALSLPVLVALAVLAVPEARHAASAVPPPRFLAGLRLVARNPAFVRMVGCVILFVSGIAVQGTLHRLVLADVMGAEGLFPRMLLVENVATLAAVPLWLRFSVRVGKHRALIAAALWIALGSVPLAFLRSGDTSWLIALVAVRGSSFASILFLSNSMAADVIDVDTLTSGEQRSGLYFAVWGMTTKLAFALGLLLGTALPAAFGYDPSASQVSAPTQARLMAIYGALPAVLMALGTLFLRGFPVTRERHAEVRAELEARGVRQDGARGPRSAVGARSCCPDESSAPRPAKTHACTPPRRPSGGSPAEPRPPSP